MLFILYLSWEFIVPADKMRGFNCQSTFCPKFWQQNHTLRVSYFGLVARKRVFGVSNSARLKLACSATETSQELENLIVASLDMIFFNDRITNALITLRRCAGWSAP